MAVLAYMIATFGLQRSLEILELTRGERDAARFIVHRADAPRFERLLGEMGLQTARYPQPLTSIHAPTAERHEYARPSQRGELIILYAAHRDPARFSLNEGHHAAMGNILGYPACCVEHFIAEERRFEENPHVVLVHPGSAALHAFYARSEFTAFPYVFNLLDAHEGRAYLSHIPCTADCSGSLMRGKQRARILEDLDPYLADELRRAHQGMRWYANRRLHFF